MGKLVYQRSGSGNFYVSGLRISTGTANREEAEAFAAKIKHDKWLAEKMGIKPPKPWHQAAFKWLEEKAGKASIQDDRDRLKWLNNHLDPEQSLGSITRDQIDAVMRLRKGVSVESPTPQNCTANKYVALVAGILNAAQGEWAWGNNAPKLRYYPTRKDVGRALTVEEWLRLEGELPEPLKSVAKFSLATGLRTGKVFALEWSQLNFPGRSLAFCGTENKLGNTIPLNSTAMSVLQRIKAGKVVHKERVFTYAGKPVNYYGKECWRAALGRAGIERIRLYDLRHTFNSWLAQNGVEKDMRMRLVGHKVGDSHDRYTHLAVEHLRKYSNLIDTLLTQSGGLPADKLLTKVG